MRSLNLGRKDCVVLDLMNNSIPVKQSEMARAPPITGPQANRIFHLIGKVPVDRERMQIPELSENQILLNKVSSDLEIVNRSGSAGIQPVS